MSYIDIIDVLGLTTVMVRVQLSHSSILYNAFHSLFPLPSCVQTFY